MDHNSPSSKAKLPFSLNEMSFIGWIGDLDLDNKEETLSSVSSALKELKQTPIKEELRYLFLQKLGAIVEQLSLQLQESYKNSLFPFSKQDTNNIELSAICAMEIAQNYKVLCESKGFKSKQMFTSKQKSQAVYNGIRSLAKQLLYKSMVYQKPAQGFWFVPGGRVLKNERLTDVFRRLCLNELALDVDFSEAKLLGAYEHFYQDNFLDSSDISTHYVVMGYELSLQCADQVSLDQQHSEQQWWPVEALLVSDEVHSNTKAYFDEAYR